MQVLRPILITGFEPFAGHGRNPSGEIVRAVGDAWHGDNLVAEVLPVIYADAGDRLEQLIRQLNPLAWIGFGLHQKAASIVLEEIAFNLDDANLSDNSGEVRRGLRVEKNGQDIYRSTLPLEAIESRLHALQIPMTHSESAGRFVCNHVFYRGLSVLADMKSDTQAGFIHLPWPCDWESTHAAGPIPTHAVTSVMIRQAVEQCISAVLQEIPT